MKDQVSQSDDGFSFGRLSHTTGFLVRRLHNRLSATWSEDLAGFSVPITPVQAGLLVLVAENPGVTQSRLLRALDVESATLAKSISRLVELDLVAKRRSKTDRRSYHLELTHRGRTILQSVEARMHARDVALCELVDAREFAAFQRVLRQLIRARSKNAI